MYKCYFVGTTISFQDAVPTSEENNIEVCALNSLNLFQFAHIATTCPNLIAPNNGYTNPATCTSHYGSICEFKCNDEFKLVGYQVSLHILKYQFTNECAWRRVNILYVHVVPRLFFLNGFDFWRF